MAVIARQPGTTYVSSFPNGATGENASPFVTEDDLSNVYVTPEMYGATSGGFVDCKTVIAAALSSGKILDGGGKTYGISGVLDLPEGARFRNATLKQLAPSASQSVITIQSINRSNVKLENIKIDRNGNGLNAGGNDAGNNGAISTAFGGYFSGGTNNHFENIECYGNDSGTGLFFGNFDATTKIIRPYVHDIFGVVTDFTASPRVGDDQVQGIWISLCSNVTVIEPRVARLGWKKAAGDAITYIFNRAIVVNGARNVKIISPNVDTVDQGIDFTGDANGGNWDSRIVTPTVKNCTSWGVKLSNLTKRTYVIGGHSETCLFAGFVDSTGFAEVEFDGQTGAIAVGDTLVGATSGASGIVSELYDQGTTGYCLMTNENGISWIDNENIQVGGVTKAVVNMPAGWYSRGVTRKDRNKFIDCVAFNCGSAGGTRGGFIGLGALATRSPVPVDFIRCEAIDQRSPIVMPFGIYSEKTISPVSYTTAIECNVEGATDTAIRGVSVQNTYQHKAELRISRSLSNVTTAQNILASGQDEFLAETNAVYEFELCLLLNQMSASAGDFAFQFGGTASITGRYHSEAAKMASVSPTSLHTAEHLESDTLASRSLVTANTSTSGYARIKGEFRTTTAGTVIPQVSVSVASATLQVLPGTFFKVRKIGANTGSNNDTTIMGSFV